MVEAIIADLPELVAMAQLAAVPASRMATAFNDGEHFFEHLTLDELDRIRAACERFAIVQAAMVQAMDAYTTAASKVLQAVPTEAE